MARRTHCFGFHGTGRLQNFYMFLGHLSIGLGVWDVFKKKVVLVSLFIFSLAGNFYKSQNKALCIVDFLRVKQICMYELLIH